MRGFQPRAQREQAQNYADGGIVGSIKGMLGIKPEDPERAKRLAEYRANQAREKQAAATPAAPAAPEKALTQYSGMSAMQRREKEAGLADGGRVKPRGFVAGAGTGVSDSIPARLSHGEYVLPADTVAQVGVPALDALKDATHTPAAQQRDEQEELYFSSGGQVRDPNRPDIPVVGTRGPVRGGGGGGLSTEAVASAMGRPQPTQTPQKSGVGALTTNPVTDPGGITRERERVVGLADGGTPEEEKRRAAITAQSSFPGSHPDAGAGIYPSIAPRGFGSSGQLATGAQNVIAAQPPKPVAAPLPAQPAPMQPQGVNAFAGQEIPGQPAQPAPVAPVAPVAQAAPAAPAAPAAALAPTQKAGLSYMDNNAAVGDEIKKSWNAGEYGRAAGQTIAGTVGMFATPAIDAAVTGAKAAWGGTKGFVSGLTGGSTPAQPSSILPVANAAPVAPNTPPASQTDVQRVGANVPAPATPLPTADQPLAATGQPAATPGNVTRIDRPGHSPLFTDGSDPTMARFQARPAGGPSAQNMQAAQALSDRSERQSVARGFSPSSGPGSGPVAPGSFTGGFSGVIGQQGGNGNMWSRTPEQQRRDAQVQSSSIHRPTAARGMASLKSLDATDLEAMRNSTHLQAETMRNATGLQREDMQQTGATTRTGMQEIGANNREAGRTGIAREELGMKQTAQGFQTRAAARMEKLQDAYQNETDPAKRSALAQQMRELSGKERPPRWKTSVVPGGVDSGGNKLPGYGLLTDEATGESKVIQPGQTQSSIPAGALVDLQKNPALAAMFDAKYGAGAAQRALGAK